MATGLFSGIPLEARRRARSRAGAWLVGITTAWSAWQVVEAILWGHTTVSADEVMIDSQWTVMWGMLIPASVALVASVIAARLVLTARPQKSKPWLVVVAVASIVNIVGMVLALVTLWVVSQYRSEGDLHPDADSAQS